METEELKVSIHEVTEAVKSANQNPPGMFEAMAPHKDSIVAVAHYLKSVIIPRGDKTIMPSWDELKMLKAELNEFEKGMLARLNLLQRINEVKGYAEDATPCVLLKVHLLHNVMQFFHTEIVLKAESLFELMKDVVHPQDHDTKNIKIQVFRDLYNKSSPLELALTLRKMAKARATSPLEKLDLAGALSDGASPAYTNIITKCVFTQLWIIECFSSGLLYDGHMYKVNKIGELYEEFKEQPRPDPLE